MDALGADFTIATPGVPRQRAHGLQGPSVRRRRAALRQRHAQPSADADDRRQPRARAAGAAGDGARVGARRARRPGRPSRGRRLGAAIRRALRRAAQRRHRDRDRRCGRQRRPACASAPRSRTCRWSAPARAWRSACPRTSGIARFERVGVAAARSRASAPIVSGSCSEATNAQVRALPAQRRRGARRSIRSRSTARTMRWSRHRRLGATRSGRRRPSARSSSTAPHRRRRSQRRRPKLGVARRRRARRADRSPRVARRPGRARRAPARRRRRRDLGRVRAGARRRAAAHRRARSIPACPGATPRRRVARRGLHLALKSGNFGGVDFFDHGLRAVGSMNEAALRDEICRVGAVAARARLRARHHRQHQRAPRRRLPDHRHRRLPRRPRCRARSSDVDAAGMPAGARRAAEQDARPAPPHLRRQRRRRLRHPHPLARTWCAPHASRARRARDDLLPPITPYFVMKVGHVPLIAYHRPGDPTVAEQVAAAIAHGARRAARRSAP